MDKKRESRVETASPQTRYNMYASAFSKTVDTQPGGDGRNLSPILHSTMKVQSNQVPLMGKTVTNFAAIRYRDNGGLFPTSPAKMGLNAEVSSSQVWNDPNLVTSQRSISQVRVAKPTLELGLDERVATVLKPRKILRDVDESKKIYKKYSAFKQQVDPACSKVDYKHYLDRVIQEKKYYDSNISHSLNHQKKILAYKNRELAQRAFALTGNQDMDRVHDTLNSHSMLKYDVEQT